MAKGSGLVTCVRGNLLTILTITGVLGGVALGFILKEAKDEWPKRDISYVKFIGDLFLNMLKGLILPLIVSSLIAAVGSLDLSLSKKIGGRGIAFYMTTTFMAIILGIILAVSIQPGKNSEAGEQDERDTEPTTVQDTLLDLIRTMFPPNLVQATLQRFRTQLTLPEGEFPNSTLPLEEYDMNDKWEEGTNIMGLVVFSIALGIALAGMGKKGKPLLAVFQSLSEATMILTTWVIWISPLGVMFLIAAEILRIEDFATVIKSLGLYFGTVLAGLAIHGLIVLPGIYFLLTRKMPFRYTGNMMPAIVMAFGSGSSTATLPITMKCLEEANGVDPRVSRFLLPIGATINMDGTALYEAVAAIFIAQLVGISLPIGKIIAISVTATAASIGAAGIPQAGLVTMVMVLNTVGLPGEYISYIVPIDWLLDRFRTAINVLGDSYGAGIINHMCQDELMKMPQISLEEGKELLADESLNFVHVVPSGSSNANNTNSPHAHQENKGFETE